MTLAAELNKSGSSWPMNRTAEETCEKEQPITLLYERGNSIRLILKVQNTVKYIPCSTNAPISPSISDVFFGEFLWCCRSLYYRGSSPFLTLAAEFEPKQIELTHDADGRGNIWKGTAHYFTRVYNSIRYATIHFKTSRHLENSWSSIASLEVTAQKRLSPLPWNESTTPVFRGK